MTGREDYAWTESGSDFLFDSVSDGNDRGMYLLVSQEAAESDPAFPDDDRGGGCGLLDWRGRLCVCSDLLYEQRQYPVVFCDRNNNGRPDLFTVWKASSEDGKRAGRKKRKEIRKNY